MPRCAGKKPDGTPCERIVGASQTYCYSHDETRREERRKNASKAGSTPRNGAAEIVEVKRTLRELAERVVTGEVPTARGAVASQLLGTFLKACEVQRKAEEQEELTARISALEEQASRGGRRWG